MKKKPKERTEIIATKVTKEARELFDSIASKLGLVSYGMLNLMVSSVIRMADGWHYCDPTLEKVIHLFNQFYGWNSMASISDGEEKKVFGAVYIFYREGKNGKFALLRKENGASTYNNQVIFDNVLKVVDPYLYRFLLKQLPSLDSNTTLEAIHELAIMHTQDPDDEYIAQLFSDNNRGDFGQPIEIRKYVPHNRMTMSNEQGHQIQTADMFEQMDTAGNEKEDRG